MPAVLAMHGFGGRSAARDRLQIVAGVPVYDTVNLPTGSRSSTSMGGIAVKVLIPWYDDVSGDYFEPSGGELWFHARHLPGVNDTQNHGLRIGVARDGTELVTVSAEDSTNRITLRVGGVLSGSTVTETFSVGLWSRLHVHVEGNSAGEHVRVYINGDLSNAVIDYTLSSDDASILASPPNSTMLWTRLSSSGDRFDDIVVFDPADPDFVGIDYFVSCDIKEMVFTGNGGEQQWTGGYTEIDERPASDSDKIVAASTGLESSFTKAAVGVDNVFAAKVMARVTRTGTAGGANLTLRSNDGTNHEDAVVAAPGDGDVQFIFQGAPDGGVWSPTKYDAARFGFISTP